MLTIVFWGAVGVLGWVYLGYPALVAVVGRARPLRLQQTEPLPTLSVAIAVHNEADQIAERIRDTLAQDTPGARIVEVLVGSDGSSDGTDEIVRRISPTEPRVRLVRLDRSGQTPTQHALFQAATGDVVVLTDAETRFAPGCLSALARAFQDPRIGCATGRLEWRGEATTATSANEGLYWRYERLVRSLESRAGFLTAVTGALLAVRRRAYRTVPASASMDHLLPLYVCEQGLLAIYVADAVASDRPISGLREQFRNRTRTAARGIRANASMVGRLAPWRHPRVALAVWSHKLARWATPWLVSTAVLTGTALSLTDRPAYAIAPIAALAGVAAAAAAHLVAGTGRKPPRALAFWRAFAVVNLAFAVAWLNVLSGRTIETWSRAELESRG